MERQKHLYSFLLYYYIFITFLQIIPLMKSSLTCAPDFKSIGDNYSSVNDPQDNFEYFYGYEFAHRAGGEYYDHWKGIYWDNEPFCYDAYNNFTRPEKLSDLTPYKITDINVVTNLEDAEGKDSYVLIEHDQTNLANFHSKACMTKQHQETNYNHGEYELLIKMDKFFEEKFLDTPHHFIFTIENPSDENVTFAFKARNFINLTEEMNTTIIERGPNMSECIVIEEEEEEKKPDTESQAQEEIKDDPSDTNTDQDAGETDAPTTKPTQEPCEREIIIINETILNWTEEYPIPEAFYFTNNYTIEAHKSMTINVSMTFEENDNSSEGGYFIITSDADKSDEPFYWPEIVPDNGKNEKLTNLEIILESNLPVGISSFSLMRRRDLEESSYLGEKCNIIKDEVSNGKCGDGFFCTSGNKCQQCENKECKNCDEASQKCTECFLISVDGQWNPPGGKGTNLPCDLDYIDITKVKINGQKKIEVPPAIHWRVTMDFWIWISDTSVLSDVNINMNIVYKDFIAFTLRCLPQGLRIYATPIEWLYEYPTWDEDEDSKKINYYKEHMLGNKNKDVIEFLRDVVGSYGEVTMEDIVRNASSNWVYIRYGFDLDSSKHYLNNLPENNLKVAQIYTEQTGMPFHLKKFYGVNEMTYLYLNNFYHPLEDTDYDGEKNITVFLRNLNIFREYIPQNIITKYYNLHNIDRPSTFPQLLVSIPFSGLSLSGANKDKIKGYNYYIRSEIGVVEDEAVEVTEYDAVYDDDIKTLRPPRNFWRLNFLELKMQPKTCDFDELIPIKCDPPNDYCFDENKPFICQEGTDERPYYLDLQTFECKTHCPFGYMHPPRYVSSKQRLYCSHYCDTGNKQCPSDDYKYTDIYTNFLCSNDFFNLYYKCFSKTEAVNTADFSGIFFSDVLRTPTIYIKFPNPYEQFAVDFWYFPDQLLRNRRYLDKIDNEKEKKYEPLKHKEPPEEMKRIIFLTDAFKIMYGDESKYNVVHFYKNGNKAFSNAAEITPINDNNWNHVVLTYFKRASDKSFTYYLTFSNKHYEDCGGYWYNIKINYDQYWRTTTTGVQLSEIIFCTKDENVPKGSTFLKNECKTAQWLDGYYRRLQIFDLTFSAKQPVFSSHQYEDDGLNGMLKHRYIFGLNSVVDNHLIDSFGNVHGYIPLLEDSYAYSFQNPDGINYILYESNFAPQGGIPNWGYQYVSGYTYTPPKLRATNTICPLSRCALCQSNDICLACKPGFSLFSKDCKGDVNYVEKTATYFYKNPGENMPERLSLKMDFTKIVNEPYFTIFFFIKIYGFVGEEPRKGPVKLIVFHQEQKTDGTFEDTFYLAWEPSSDPGKDEKLYFYVNDQIMFSYKYYREYNFGLWVPISITAFREEDRRFKMNMVQASILYENLAFDENYNPNKELFPYVKFTQFSITNKWVGLLSDIKIYSKFIMNAWGIIKHQHESPGSENDDIPDSHIEEITLKSDAPDSCLVSSQILNQPASGYKVVCVADYNPHLYRGCSSMEAQTIRYHQGDGYNGLCNACCPSDTAPHRCLGGHEYSCGTWSEDHSCENQTPIWKTNYLSFTGNKIVCSRIYYIDYNRYQYAKSDTVESPQDVWAVDFWFKTSTNQAVKERTLYNGYSTGGNNNNFNEFIIDWNYHLRVRVRKQVVSEIENTFTYIGECYPLVVLEHPDLNSPEMIDIDMNNIHYKWAYITCGVNFQEKVFYMTTNNRFTQDVPFTSKLVLIPGGLTTFSITENSRVGYGFTFIYQLRLWHCYNCAHAFRNLRYDVDDKNFNAVYHCFWGRYTETGVGQSFADAARRAKATYMYQAADFPGYTLNYGPGEPVLCDETIYQYYNEDKNQCERHYNIARMPSDYKMSIPSSRNARYTMDFWFFVENSAELSPGVNLLWDYHMSITLLRDTSNRNTINAICFPQSYRDNVDLLGGQEIIELYDKALNKDKYAFYQGSSKWNFVRCAVDQTRKRFFVNDNLELDLEGEILYGTTRNYRPFRFFKISAWHDLKFQNARFNPTRIFLRQIKCYRDYIDFRLMELKYKACGYPSGGCTLGFWTDSSCQFYPIAFCFDYGEIINPNWPCTHTRRCFSGHWDSNENRGLVYHIFRENADNTLSANYYHWRFLLEYDDDVYYPTFPDIYMPSYCCHGMEGGDREACSGTQYICRLRNNTAYFWPYSSTYKYLDLNTLTMVDKCTDSCRPPDSYYRNNFCLIEKYTNNMMNCAEEKAKKGDYYDKYECLTGYVRVYYECIEQDIVPFSAMYFSNVYSFPNIIFNTADKSTENLPYLDWNTETRLASYYIEIWMKFDALNYRKEISDIEHYLYAHPHQIIKDPVDQKYKYSNKLISQGSYYYTLNSMHNYEWNKIIIENYYDQDTKLFSIKLYLNYEFENPELSIPDLESEIYKLHFRGFGFCDKTDSYCRVNNDPVYLRWGVAWYRNFRVWDADITSLQTIQACEYGYTQLINAQKYYFPLTVDTIQKNTIVDRIDPNKNKMVLNYWIFYQGNDFQEAFDNAMRENYSTDNFDKTFVYENNYISGINEDGTDYLISACAGECKRCYSSSNTDCYECRLGYSIYGKQCKVRTGYFLKTPPNNTDIREISITIKDDDKYFELEKETNFTMTLYIKFFGIELDKVVPGQERYILVCFYKDLSNGNICKTYIGYNYLDKTIIFVVNGEEIYSSRAKYYVGIWTHFGISIHRQESDNDHFPNMINFMIDQQELIPKPGFDPTKDPVYINTFTIRTEPICFYSSFKVFSTFYFGPYGHVNAIAATRGSKLLYQVNLYGSSNINCITNADLAESPTVNIKTLIPVCIPDYLPYEDSNNICSDDNHFMDVIYKVSPPCELCDSQCITNCFSLESSACTCDYYEGLYWVKTDDEYQSYECQKIDSINFAFFESVTLYGLNLVSNDEMTIVFWLDIYEYIDNKFDSLEIIWDHHLAVKIYGNGKQNDEKFLKIECHGDYDLNNPEIGQTKIYDEERLLFNKWNYIVCSIDKFHNVSRIDGLDEQPYTKVTYGDKILTSSLTIVDKTENFNYGFSFVRELKLYSSYNFPFWDDSHHNLQKYHFEYLLHYFHNDFSQDKLADTKITDQVEGLVTKLNVKAKRIGYNYVKHYEYLVLCEEGYVYNENSKRCDIFDSQECIVPRTSEEKCLLCGSSKPYLKDDDQCYYDCSPNYFADDYFKQCRKCDPTCYTCFGKRYNNCLSCIDPYYYIASLHICVLNCQEYGLVISTKLANTCEELVSESYISVPVFLNNSYDYNPENADYVSKIINRDIFNRIEGHLGEVSFGVETLWVYNRTATLELNKKYRYFDVNDIPDENPIISDATELSINLNNEYFKYGYKYVFDWQIISKNGEFQTSHTHTYILMMNDYPLVGLINILPAEGYLTNTFLMTINKCTDDVSAKNLLLYKFSYFKKRSLAIDGYGNEESDDEIIIQNWSKKSEALFKFPELNLDPEEDGKYYIRGYCKDEYGLYYSEIQEVRLIEIPTQVAPTEIEEVIPLEESIQTIDIEENLETDQLLNRAEALSTATIDFDKGYTLLNRTNVTIYNSKGILQENLVLVTPNTSDGSKRNDFCNNRGAAYIMYQYLVCDCDGFDGNTCQIDHASYDYIKDIYNQLFTKVKRMQTEKYNKDLIKSVNLIMKSGAQFMDIDNMDFMLESIDFINLYRNKFAAQMMEGNSYELYFDIYNSLIDYGLSMVNKLKYKNFISKNSKNAQGTYSESKFRNAVLAKGDPKIVQDYFNKIKVSLQNLLEFYAANKKEVRFINKNINVYVSLINENFQFDTYFDKEKKLYEPYMNFRRCLEQTMIQSQGNPSYRVYLSAIMWKVSPFMSSESLYWNTSSPVITFKFLDYDTGEKIYLSNCGNADNQIQLYFPVSNYNLTNRINEKKALLSPENQYNLNDDIFCDPVYINKSGAVFNSTPEERRNKYFLGFNFSCEYYHVKSEDQSNIKLTKETLDYHKYSKNNYIQCLSNKLLQESYGEFVVESYEVPAEFHLNSRFFYLKHYMLLAWSENYSENQAFYYFIILSVVYAGLSLGYIYFEKYHYINKQRLGELKTEATKMNLPYRDEYIFNNDLQMEQEIKGKLKDKRKPNMEEMNLDTNNVDIGIMADNIASYNKGFKSKENALGFTPEYFGIKEKKQIKMNSRYFPGEVDVRNHPDMDDEISPERLEKMKKFYQVGFKGLNPNELNQKEMQISKDKKRIMIKKQQKLGKIIEQDEDDALDFDVGKKDFFKDSEEDDMEEDQKEKETTINKKTRNRKSKLDQYHDFVSSNEQLESEANLKSSKRTTNTKKFFGLNPPKKEKPTIRNSLVFTEKDQQKIGKSDSKFFKTENEDIVNSKIKNKRKQKNIFQNEYGDLYKPGFKGPKVVSENLGFYSRETLDFEQDMDTENKNPPYFGKRFRKIKGKNEEEKGQGQNAGLRVGFYYKNRQIDLDDVEEELPALAENLTFEVKMEEFYNYSISFKGFLYKNLKSRYILLTTFDRMSIVYQRYMRAGNFAAQLSIFALVLSIFFTADEKQTAYVSKSSKEIPNFILYCFCADVFGCIAAHLPAYMFWVNDKKFRKLYTTIRKDGGIHVLKEIEDIIKKGRFFWNLLGIIIQIIYIVVGFYFAFGFCATYYYQRSTFALALICTCGFDFLAAEFLWEIVIALLFYIRDVSRIIVFFGTLFNTLRNIKHLV